MPNTRLLHHRTRARLALVLALFLLPAASACGSDDESPDTPPGAETRETEAGAGAETSQSSGRVRLRRVGEFESPIYVTGPRDDRRRVFVVERRGTVQLIRSGRRARTPFLDLRRTDAGSIPTDGERGLLSIAFPRDYSRSRLFYLYYTDRRGDITIAEMRRSRSNPDRADHSSLRVVITQEHRRFSNHNGGQVEFGPDGLLYAGLGDGGGAFDPLKSGQDLSTLLGKMIRIDPRRRGGRSYTVPAGNPFVDREGARPEIWAYGLRNPYRFSFDRRTGAFVISDVGQDKVEEVNFLARNTGAGSNFGWSCFEGSQAIGDCRPDNHREPVLERSHESGACSITGGYVVRDPSLGSLVGRYLYGDFCDSRLRSAGLSSDRASGDRAAGLELEATASFGEDGCGRIYVVSLNGRVNRLVGSRPSPCTRAGARR